MTDSISSRGSVRVIATLALSATAVALTVATGGCQNLFGTAQPTGTSIGTYELVGTLDGASTCAELVAAAPVPYDFDVSLRYDGDNAYWTSGGNTINGTVSATGQLDFTTSSTTQLQAADAGGVAECDVTRTDIFTGALAGDPSSEAGVATLTGTLRYEYTLPSGVDCTGFVGPISDTNPSPTFSTMPCYIGFAVTGTRSGAAE